MRLPQLLCACLVAIAFTACDKAKPQDEQEPAAKATETATPAATGEATAAKPEVAKAGEHECTGEKKEEHDCADGASTELSDDTVDKRKDPDGKEYLHAGKELTGAQVVTVPELLAKPDDYAGKLVRLEGNLSAMCVHRRAWFAVAANDKSGAQVRVITAPVFLVPPDSIGKSVRTEGHVDVLEIPAKRARHLAKEHKLDEPPAAAQTVKQVVVRAVGADFI